MLCNNGAGVMTFATSFQMIAQKKKSIHTQKYGKMLTIIHLRWWVIIVLFSQLFLYFEIFHNKELAKT